jgi:hypothetical protein
LLQTAAVLIGFALLSLAGVGHAATYKWVDDRGVVHYSDKVPPEAADKSRTELNAQGLPIKKSAKAPTPEELRAKEREEARARAVEKERAEIARRDRALLSSYTTENEIDLARNRSLRTIEASIKSAEAYASQLKIRKADAEAKKATYAGKTVPPALERELESISSESARQAELIAQKNKDAAAVHVKYDADKQRWRELVAARSATEPSPSTAMADAPATRGYPVDSTSIKKSARK